MRRMTLAGTMAALALAPMFFAAAAVAPAGGGSAVQDAVPQTRPARPRASATQPRTRNDARHADFLQIIRRGGANIDVLFVGDSITEGWMLSGREVWDKQIEPLKPANFGIGGDTTQGVLWRMRNGELDGFKAKVIVLMLGTNNIYTAPNAEIAEGDRLILEEFKKRQPQAKILVFGVFPRSANAADDYRKHVREINTILATFADNKQVFYMDIGDKFLEADGTLPRSIMPDMLHPNARGYQIWADAMLPKLQELLKG